MKAVVQNRYGSADALAIQDVRVPTPDDQSVLVRVKSASVNALDWRLMRGSPFIARLMGFGLFHPKQKIRGVDVAGRVEQVRKPDSKFKVGDEVFGLGSGSFAEYVAADERELVAKPPTVDFPQAATLGVAAFTALQGLRDIGKVHRGERVLITGAGSGVGTFAVQIAKWLGANVTALTNPRSVDIVRSIGADEVVDYTTDDLTLRPGQFDLIFDISGPYSLRATHRLLTPHGRIVQVGARKVIARMFGSSLLRALFGYRVKSFFAKPRFEDFVQLKELVDEGHLRPVIDRVYSLEDTPKAMAYVESHQVVGKVVIHVA